MFQRSSLAWPIILASILLPLIVALMILWIIGQAASRSWVLLAVGAIFILLILLGVVAYFYWTIREVRLNRRQANFLDAVTHELKSPIASLKLCLQTLDMRSVTPEQQREFHRFMMEDIQRLDGLIDHMLIVARLGAESKAGDGDLVSLPQLLRSCVEEVCRRYDLDPARISISADDCLVKSRSRDLEIVFLNLLDNAVKYGGKDPQVVVESRLVRGRRVVTRISDNGPGVSYDLRRKIFHRFYRGGSELERTTKGTGLGLHIVKSLVSRIKGKVTVHGRGPLKGATFEVELPAAPLSVAIAFAQESSSRQRSAQTDSRPTEAPPPDPAAPVSQATAS